MSKLPNAPLVDVFFEDDYDFYHFDAPPVPEESMEVEITIIEERDGELEVPDYLFEEIEMYD